MLFTNASTGVPRVWKVIWRLQGDAVKACGQGDGLLQNINVYGFQFMAFYHPRDSAKASRFWFHLDMEREFEVNVAIKGKNFTCKRSSEDMYFSPPPEGEDVEIVIRLVRLAPDSLEDASPELLKFQLALETKALRTAEGEAKRLGGELEIEKSARQESEAETKRLAAEVGRCHALIAAGSQHAAERECRLTRSATKIQAKWRQLCTKWHVQREQFEIGRRLKQEKRVRAISCLQSLWRLKQKRCQRRWLRAQNGCSDTETPYDAILASMTLLT